MSDFWLYFNIGLKHVLDINGYDHVLFLMALSLPYTFKDWKKVLVLATLFTIGHTLSLVLSVFGVVTVNAAVIEFLIPVTILITALYNIFRWARKSGGKNDSLTFISVTTLFFGVIHGLGFSNYFKVVLSPAADEKLLPVLEFALGIEAAQIIIVVAMLLLSFVVQEFLRFAKRDWILVISAFIAGVVVPMIIGSEIW
ncbi:HupE / UreJ protein [Flavobacterium album]|uniref:HupE / UreJ protein n=1 Tax=Flavobacterium album TaxID=2175091 RepID=A0A2S1QUV6_9FLAO|nr:HupE/UreJ family protein [Flavobacterium album]AWH84156.1 HupE / UreJ protein [Flavobacterium album]